jgi:hypothetical protein
LYFYPQKGVRVEDFCIIRNKNEEISKNKKACFLTESRLLLIKIIF